MKDYEVRVFCPQCGGGDNAIWKGSLIDWALQMGKEAKNNKDIPAWTHYAYRHEQAHCHTVMVEYPNRIVPLFDPLRVKGRPEHER
jgi:hypothetical protein